MSKLGALLLAAVLTLSGCSLQQREGNVAFRYACAALSRDCRGISPPTLVYADLTAMYGVPYLGAFSPVAPDIVQLDRQLLTWDEGRRMQIIVHEVTHYVDFKFGLTMPPHGSDACVTEGLAFSVSNLWSLANDVPPRWDWRTSYAGC